MSRPKRRPLTKKELRERILGPDGEIVDADLLCALLGITPKMRRQLIAEASIPETTFQAYVGQTQGPKAEERTVKGLRRYARQQDRAGRRVLR
jgi:hypothetical protein